MGTPPARGPDKCRHAFEERWAFALETDAVEARPDPPACPPVSRWTTTTAVSRGSTPRPPEASAGVWGTDPRPKDATEG